MVQTEQMSSSPKSKKKNKQNTKTQTEPPPAPTVWRDIDRIIHEPVRLGILSVLKNHSELDFTDLRDALGLTQGNLASHLKRLEDAGYLRLQQSGVAASSRTRAKITKTGRSELKQYWQTIKSLKKVAYLPEGK